jgi:hypothetical protein
MSPGFHAKFIWSYLMMVKSSKRNPEVRKENAIRSSKYTIRAKYAKYAIK